MLGESRVEAVRFERTRPTGDGGVAGTGEFVDVPVQAVYRAVGYASSPLPGVPFDERDAVIPNEGGRVTDAAGTPIPGVYATGWIKRGPVGLIGHTKGDALETITNLLADAAAGTLPAPVVAAGPDGDEVFELLEARGIRFTTWAGWLGLDAHERGLGEAWEPTDAAHADVARERVKVVPRDEQVEISRSGALVGS